MKCITSLFLFACLALPAFGQTVVITQPAPRRALLDFHGRRMDRIDRRRGNVTVVQPAQVVTVVRTVTVQSPPPQQVIIQMPSK